MTYQPRPNSYADKAREQLVAHGEMSAAALADAIDMDDPSIIRNILQIPVREGYFRVEKRDGLMWWSMGDGTPTKPAADDGDDGVDDDPVVQRVVAAGSRPKTEPAKVAAATVKPRAKAAASQPEPTVQAPAPAEEVQFLIERETRLVIAHGGQRLVLNQADLGRLRELIEDVTT